MSLANYIKENVKINRRKKEREEGNEGRKKEQHAKKIGK